MLDHLSEGSCYRYKIPNYPIDIIFGYINKFQCPEAQEDDWYIIVWIGDYSKDRNVYRLSLTEPKYIYDSNPIPEEYRKIIFDSIVINYVQGITAINEYEEKEVFPRNFSNIPNYYNLL